MTDPSEQRVFVVSSKNKRDGSRDIHNVWAQTPEEARAHWDATYGEALTFVRMS